MSLPPGDRRSGVDRPEFLGEVSAMPDDPIFVEDLFNSHSPWHPRPSGIPERAQCRDQQGANHLPEED